MPVEFGPMNFKEGIESHFGPCGNAMRRRPYCPSCMERSYGPSDLAQSLGAICAQYRYLVIHHAITIMCACVIPRVKGNSHLLGGLSYEKIRRYNNSPTPRWPPQQIPPLNFLDLPRLSCPWSRVENNSKNAVSCSNFIK